MGMADISSEETTMMERGRRRVVEEMVGIGYRLDLGWERELGMNTVRCIVTLGRDSLVRGTLDRIGFRMYAGFFWTLNEALSIVKSAGSDG